MSSAQGTVASSGPPQLKRPLAPAAVRRRGSAGAISGPPQLKSRFPLTAHAPSALEVTG
jgi:hypothetical protein